MSAVTSPVGSEALDEPTCPPAIARAMLGDIARSNTLFGGRAAVWFGSSQLLTPDPSPSRPSPQPLSSGEGRYLANKNAHRSRLGAGAGDIAAYVATRAAEIGVKLVPLAADRHRAAARLCRERRIPGIVGDALGLTPCASGQWTS